MLVLLFVTIYYNVAPYYSLWAFRQWFSKGMPWNFGCYIIAHTKIINNFV
jgi:hypothetical protein